MAGGRAPTEVAGPVGSTQAFINAQLPAARAAAAQLGIPVSVVLAQWINETGSGSSRAFVEGHNYAGVSYLDQPEAAVGATLQPGLAPILAYPTPAAGVAGYIARWRDPVYAATRKIWSQTSDPIAVARSVEASPWAAGHYGGNGLETLITSLDLTAYDNPAAGAGTSPPPPGTTAELTGFGLHNLDPLNWIGSVLGGAKADILKIVLTGAFVTGGLVLIVGGLWRAAAPRVRDAVQTVGPTAAAAAV